MRDVTYSMGISLDGYIVGPDGGFDWSVPDQEVFRFVTDEIRNVDVHLMGRRLYETMVYWETAEQDQPLDDSEREWAAIWKPLPKVVFSTTLSAVQGNARLASGTLAEEIERLRSAGDGDIAIGGAALAAEAREVVAFDLTPEMLRRARQRCAQAGHENVTFKEGSATELPFADGAFDGVVTRLSVHHFQDPRLVFDEIARVLRPGGTFVLADVVSSENQEESALQNAIEILRDPSHTRMLPQSELLSMVEGAGFDVASHVSWDRPREFEEWMGIINDATRVGPIRTVVHALAGAGRTAGMGLSLVDGGIEFFHRWILVVARKPG